MNADSIVFGANGFIGRAVVAELLRRGHTVAAGVHNSPGGLTDWLADRGVDSARLTVVRCDITRPDLGLSDAEPRLADVRDIYNSAALFAFGLGVEEARLTNVTGALNILSWAATRPGRRRLVHITGYRVSVPDSSEASYDNGAYAASKFEADAALRHEATVRGIPLTIANPSTVLGNGQYTGLAELVADLWRGKLPALPGNRSTFVPLVTLDYLARFLVTLPSRPDTAGRSYTVLDPETPNLPDLFGVLAEHLRVRAPRFGVPVGLLRRLPRALTGVHPEALGFLASDRYDTSAADRHANAVGLRMPPIEGVLREWADHLVASRFGQAPAIRQAGFRDGTWLAGEPHRPDFVLLHGLPVDSDSWTDVVDRVGVPTLSADLPGLGRSAPAASIQDWLAGLLEPVTSRPVLVAHSLACDPAIRYAVAHPDRISSLVLVSPFFLQRRAGWLLRSSLAALSLRRTPPDRLAQLLGVPVGPAVVGAAGNLHRPRVARRTVAALRKASKPARRNELGALLERVSVPVAIVAGSADPLVRPDARPVTVISGAGHYPQLSHPYEVSGVLAAARRRTVSLPDAG